MLAMETTETADEPKNPTPFEELKARINDQCRVVSCITADLERCVDALSGSEPKGDTAEEKKNPEHFGVITDLRYAVNEMGKAIDSLGYQKDRLSKLV